MGGKNRVLVAMSGGVDSSVAAALLKDQGYDVIGATLQLWPKDAPPPEDDTGCCSLSAVEDARRVADMLGIPFYVLNFRDVFEGNVIETFIEEYMVGRTPNPCIACNKRIKFDILLKKALALGMDYVATGHYAKIQYNPERDRYLLYKAKDPAKDQTYFLYGITQDQLRHTLFPLAPYNKEKVRELAKGLNLSVAEKAESQEICFVTDNDYRGFIKNRVGDRIEKGPFLDTQGNVIGEHRGIPYYTIGQRKGLGLALGYPAYVVDIDQKNNAVVVGKEKDIFKKEMIVSECNFIPFSRLEGRHEVNIKVRYRTEEAPGVVQPEGSDRVRVLFKNPRRAITPGQAAVFYKGDMVIGGGTIETVVG